MGGGIRKLRAHKGRFRKWSTAPGGENRWWCVAEGYRRTFKRNSPSKKLWPVDAIPCVPLQKCAYVVLLGPRTRERADRPQSPPGKREQESPSSGI